jgi:Type I restriction modification DNA specificity domain
MWRTLADVADVFTGYPFRGKVNPQLGGDLAVVQIKDVDATAGLRLKNLLMLRDEGGKYARYLLEAGDVLFQSRGSQHPVAIVRDGLHGIAALGLHIIRPKKKYLRPEYLAWYMNHPNTQERLKDAARGSYIPFVAKGDLAAFKVPIPPLDVQDRIGRIDQLRRQEQQLTSRLNELMQEQTDAATWVAATRKD